VRPAKARGKKPSLNGRSDCYPQLVILYHAYNDRLVDQCQPSPAPKRLRLTAA
jgi:hypothetical protein